MNARGRRTPRDQRLGGTIDVLGEHVQGQARRLDPVAPPLSPLVDVEKPELVRERIQPGPKKLMVEPRPAVEDEDGQTRADLFDPQRDPVGKPNVHGAMLGGCQGVEPGKSATRLQNAVR